MAEEQAEVAVQRGGVYMGWTLAGSILILCLNFYFAQTTDDAVGPVENRVATLERETREIVRDFPRVYETVKTLESLNLPQVAYEVDKLKPINLGVLVDNVERIKSARPDVINYRIDVLDGQVQELRSRLDQLQLGSSRVTRQQ